MRALCGAIITAGALISLGLTAVGFGIRFQTQGLIPDPKPSGVFYGSTSLMICLVIGVAAAIVGLAIAFVGLAFHHERRYRESQLGLSRESEARTAVSPGRVSI